MTLPKCHDTPENRALRVRSRIERRFETVVNKSLALLPDFLADCESHVAARLITDLLAIYLNRPVPESDGPDCLSCLLEDIASEPESASPNPSDLSDMSGVSHPTARELTTDDSRKERE